MTTNIFDPRLGPSRVAYPVRILGWVGMVLGAALLLAGLLLCVVVVADPSSRSGATSDLVAGACLLVSLVLGGVVFVVASLVGLMRRPVRHFCDHGTCVVAKSGAVGGVVLWRAIPKLTIVRRVQRGATAGYMLVSGSLRILVPSEDLARRGHALWQAAQTAG